MLPFPHRYTVAAALVAEDAGPTVDLQSNGLKPLRTAAPAEFDGPGDLWSPETLLVGAISDCIAITFRGVARASKLAWLDFRCETTGTLERIDGVTRFTRIDIDVRLDLPDGADEALARRVLDRVKRSCLITNSLNADVHLHVAIEMRTIDAHAHSA